jgi:hypothetical protein
VEVFWKMVLWQMIMIYLYLILQSNFALYHFCFRLQSNKNLLCIIFVFRLQSKLTQKFALYHFCFSLAKQAHTKI